MIRSFQSVKVSRMETQHTLNYQQMPSALITFLFF